MVATPAAMAAYNRDEVERVILALYAGQNVAEANSWLTLFVASPVSVVRCCALCRPLYASRSACVALVAPATRPPSGLCCAKRAPTPLTPCPFALVNFAAACFAPQAAWEISVNMLTRCLV